MRFGKRGGWQGAVHLQRPQQPVFPYQRAFLALARSRTQLNSFLSIGVGTGTAMNSVLHTHQTVKLHGVEIDDVVLESAIQYFGAPNHRQAEYWIGDGMAFLTSNHPYTYDLIFIDAYMRNQVYQPALQPYILQALRSRLTPKGVAVYNIIAANYRSDAWQEFLETAKNTFEIVLDMPVGVPLGEQNRLCMVSNDETLAQSYRQALREAPELKGVERTIWPFRLKAL